MKKKFRRFLKNIIEILGRPEMGVLPGQLAYFFILSILPTITIISYIASFFRISLDDIAAYFNFTINPMLVDFFTPALENNSFSLIILIVFIVGIYIISNGTNSIIITANNIYGIKQNSFVKRRIKALLMVVILLMLFLFIAMVPIFGNFMLSLIEKVTGYKEIYNIFNAFRMPISWLIIFLFIKVLYMIAPDKPIPSRHVNIGSLFTSIGWIVATEIYLYYCTHIADYSLLYSSIGNVAILMIWMYILSTIFVIGLALNYKEEPYEIEKAREQKELKELKSITKKNQNKKWYEE